MADRLMRCAPLTVAFTAWILLMTPACGGSTDTQEDIADGGVDASGVDASPAQPRTDAAPPSPDGSTPVVCVPRSCVELKKDCAAVDDGCGHMLNCGSCTAPASCGGSGTANVCGVACPSSCPSGQTCKPSGVCGSSEEALALSVDIARVPVSGTITRNGQLIASSACAGLALYETTRNVSFSVPISCEFTDTGWSFSQMLYPGSYRAIVVGKGEAWDYGLTQIPTTPELLVVGREPLTGVKLDAAPLIKVTGAVTTSQGTPVYEACTASGANPAALQWTDDAHKRDFRITINCSGSGGWSYSGTVLPGTYRVELEDMPSERTSLLLQSALTITAQPEASSQNFALPFGSIAGKLRRGALTTEQCTGTSIELRHKTSNRSYSLAIACSEASELPFASSKVIAGPYQVVFKGPLGGVELMPSFVVEAKPMELSLDAPLVFALSPSATLNGSPIAINSSYSSLLFRETVTGLQNSTRSDCTGGPCTFGLSLYAGTYDVSYSDSITGLPYVSLLAPASVRIPEASPAPAIAFEGVRATVSVTRNGVPVVGRTCSSSAGSAEIRMKELTRGRELSQRVSCDTSKGWLFEALLAPGTYRATIEADFVGSPFAGAPKQSTADFSIDGATSQYNVNFPGVINIAGEITRNGQRVVPSPTCGSLFLRFKDLDRNWSKDAAMTCDAKLGWRFSAALVQGTYQVSVQPDPRTPTSSPILPAVAHTVASGLALTSDRSDLTIDSKTRDVTLRLTQGGQPLGFGTCTRETYPGSQKYVDSYVQFTSLTNGEVVKGTIRCDKNDWRVEGMRVYAEDTYRVTVLPEPQSMLAPGDFLAYESLQVP